MCREDNDESHSSERARSTEIERDHDRRLRLAIRNRRQRELYGPKHHRRRREFARRINRGEVIICPRCEGPIGPDQLWDSGHDDRDRRGHGQN